MAPKVWIRMYWAKQRARSPLSTNWPATAHVGAVIGDGVSSRPDACSLANSWACVALAAATSAAIPFGVMSGVP